MFWDDFAIRKKKGFNKDISFSNVSRGYKTEFKDLELNKKSVSDSDVFLVNMGSIRLINDLVDVNKRSFVLTINDINLEYAENLSDWINSLEKINYILPTYEIIEKIYLDMKIESLYSNKI